MTTSKDTNTRKRSCYHSLKYWFIKNPKSLLTRNDAIKMFPYGAGNIENNLARLIEEKHIRRVLKGMESDKLCAFNANIPFLWASDWLKTEVK